MSDIQQELAALSDARVTTAVLSALDYVVPGEWANITSLEQAVEVHLGVSDPAMRAEIVERARALYASQPHYARALRIFRAVDTADKVAAAAVAANQLGGALSFLSIFGKVTPKPDTTQAIDAALKLAAEVSAFALLRGVPVTSLAEAQAFPAALATYARADMMRLAAWITIDGLLPLGPQFATRIVELVKAAPLGFITDNPLFGSIKDALPGSGPEEQKGFILSTLQSGSAWMSEFVAARGLTQQGVASTFGSLVGKADTTMDVLAATLDATTDYYAHTGLQSVARVLVHDAQESLAAGAVVEAAPIADAAAEEVEGSSWFKKAAIVGGIGAGVAAVGAAGLAAAGASALWRSWSSDDDDEDEAQEQGDLQPDPQLMSLDDNQLAAREQDIELRARQILSGPGTEDEKIAQLQQLRGQRRRLRRARRMRMRRMMQMRMQQGGGGGPRRGLGRPGMGMGMGRRGMGGGRGGRGGGRGRF